MKFNKHPRTSSQIGVPYTLYLSRSTRHIPICCTCRSHVFSQSNQAHSVHSEHQKLVLFKAHTAAVSVNRHLNSWFRSSSSIDLCARATYKQHLKGLLAINTDFLASTLVTYNSYKAKANSLEINSSAHVRP